VSRLPVLFVSHGAPTVALETGGLQEALLRFARDLGRPRAIVVVSAHWTAPGAVGVTAAPRHRLVHDFYGFPRSLHEVRWPAPGAPDLAARVAALLGAAGLRATLDPTRGLDHGAWVPLRLGWPDADVPVVQVALPEPPPQPRLAGRWSSGDEGEPADLLRMGAALAPLRDEGVLLVLSGGVVHNLGEVRLGDEGAAPEPWAVAFDGWVRDRVLALDADGLARWREDAPHARRAHPSPEHFAPLLVAVGARLPGDRAEPVYEDMRYGTLSMRSFALRPGGAVAVPTRSS
jgi:4,5-DOPA dioxygenase extradiol